MAKAPYNSRGRTNRGYPRSGDDYQKQAAKNAPKDTNGKTKTYARGVSSGVMKSVSQQYRDSLRNDSRGYPKSGDSYQREAAARSAISPKQATKRDADVSRNDSRGYPRSGDSYQQQAAARSAISPKQAVKRDADVARNNPNGYPRSGDDYQKRALENAFGNPSSARPKNAITPGKQTQDKGIVATAPKSSSKANTAAATKNSQSISQSGYNYDRNKQTGRKQIEEAFKPNTSGKPTGKIVKHEEPKYNPAKYEAEQKAAAEAKSKAAAAQAAAKANAKGGMSDEAKKKAAAAAARRGR